MTVSSDVYSQLAVESTKALLTSIDPNQIAAAGWDLFIKDVFDLTDALALELERRLKVREKAVQP